MMCTKQQEKKCHKWFNEEVLLKSLNSDKKNKVKEEKDTRTDFENCQNLFDGCNMCKRSLPNGPLACTRMMCAKQQEKKCHKWFNEEVLLKSLNSDKKNKIKEEKDARTDF